MSTMSTDPSAVPDRGGLLADVALRAGLTRFIRGRVPASEVDDIVQATLTEALASRHAPDEAEQLRRWVYGIARHKCVDFYRHQGREAPAPEPVDGDIPAEDEPLSARDLLRWAEQELPEGEHAESTLEWMLREAGGDKLESIADEEQIPAPRVRQRVARMRKHYRARWAAQVAAIVAAALLAVGAVALWRYLQPAPRVADDIELKPERVSPLDHATELRRQAFRACEEREWQRCLERLDEAARLDPAGETDPRVEEARQVAGEALNRDEREDSRLAPETQPEPDLDKKEFDSKKDSKKVMQVKPSPKTFKDKKSFEKSFDVQVPTTPTPPDVPPKSEPRPEPKPDLTQQVAPQSKEPVLRQQQTSNIVRDGKESQQVMPDNPYDMKSVGPVPSPKKRQPSASAPVSPQVTHQRFDIGPYGRVTPRGD